MSQLNQREKRLALLTGLLAVIGLLYIGVFGSSDTISVSAETAEKFDDLFAKINSVEAQKKTNQAYRQKIGNDTGQFVGMRDRDKLLMEIIQVAGQSGLNLKGTTPSTVSGARPLPRIDFSITGECQFEQLIQFLDNLRKAKYLIHPTQMKLALKDKNQPALNVQITLSSFLVDEQGAPATTTTLARGEQ